jgi:hypothetical protein
MTLTVAAHRQNVPLRQTSTIQVDDGTTCRMPSPIPGPLRGESEFEPTGVRDPLDRCLPRHGSTATAHAIPVALFAGEAA